MEILGFEPKTITCKIIVLPTKLYPLYYPKKDLNLHGYKPAKLKFALSTIPALGF
jgi:hypothetical protein